MNSQEITALVTESAKRFGDRNTQQRRQLADRLSKSNEHEIADGLLRVFMQGEPPPAGREAQELAGALLTDMNPKGMTELEEILVHSLSRYELSVEQLPRYLMGAFGLTAVLETLNEIESRSLSAPERRALETLRFWLRNVSEQGMSREA